MIISEGTSVDYGICMGGDENRPATGSCPVPGKITVGNIKGATF
jgi:hypothetical protein